jgi:hypothetical protein
MLFKQSTSDLPKQSSFQTITQLNFLDAASAISRLSPGRLASAPLKMSWYTATTCQPLWTAQSCSSRS